MATPPPGIARARLDNANPEDTFKIMLATDNHVGFNERDPVRGQDSIKTFEEILQLAVKHDVDFILLAGDLFHENRPSRDCLYRTIALLREYTLGNKPVEFELLSDPDEGKAEGCSFPAINYEDPNFNVGIPVFSIHGNHDDPQGAGPEGALCALDILSVAGVMNYMGKIELPTVRDDADGSAGIAIRPVLLRKGKTQLGLYGVGNVKDQRMHFELRSNHVRMHMPRNKQEWFNILLLHQNRVKHGPQEAVPEGMFDDSINLVIWGHEHDCRIVPEPVAGKEYCISQPGSSVATSLADGESIPKQVAIVKIHERQYSLEPITLRTVRPFVLDEIVLTEVAEEEGIDVNDQMAITKYLRGRVNALIQRASAEWDARNAAAVEAGEQTLPAMLPLVRLKVDTTGISETSNPVRFGMEFQGRIANPRDVLVFHRAKKAAARGGKVRMDEPALSIDDPDLSPSEKLAKVRVETLVKEYLGAQELQLLVQEGLSDAIKTFVDKDDPHSIKSFVNTSLTSMILNVKSNATAIDEDALDEAVMQAKEKEDDLYRQRKEKGEVNGKKKGKAKTQDDSEADSIDSMLVDGDDDFEEAPPRKTAAKSKKAPAATISKAKAKAPAKVPAKGKGKKAVASESEDEIVDDDDEEEEEEAPKPKKTNRAAVLAKKAPAKKKAPAAAKQTTLDSALSARSSRAAASKAKGKMAAIELSDDSD